MPILETIGAAMLAGATAKANSIASAVVQKAYDLLTSKLTKWISSSTVAVLEEGPGDELRQQLFKKELTAKQAQLEQEPELVSAAKDLLQIMAEEQERGTLFPEGVGIILKGIKAGSLDFGDIDATKKAVVVSDVDVTGHVSFGNLKA